MWHIKIRQVKSVKISEEFNESLELVEIVLLPFQNGLFRLWEIDVLGLFVEQL